MRRWRHHWGHDAYYDAYGLLPDITGLELYRDHLRRGPVPRYEKLQRFLTKVGQRKLSALCREHKPWKLPR